MKLRVAGLNALNIVAAGLIVLPIVLIFSSSVLSQNNSSQLGQGLEISPPLIRLDANPGQTVVALIKLRNITDSTLIASPRVNDFVAQGEEGLPKLLLDESADKSSYGLKSWVGNINKLTIAPKEQKEVKIVLDVPNDASPGGHYGVVRFSASAPEVEDTGVSLSASIGTLVLVKVSGDVQESAKIEQFGISKNDKPGSLFETGPLTVFQRVKNTGNVHFQPTGTVVIKNFRGKEVSKLKINENGGSILPDSVRKFEQEFKDSRLFGRYTATMNLTYGDNNKALSDNVSFWVIPYRLIAVVLGAVVLMVVLIKRYNKHVIKQANKKRK